MSQFLQVGKSCVNLAHVRRVERTAQGALVFLAGEQPLAVEGEEAQVLLAALSRLAPAAQAGLKEKAPASK